MACLSIGNEADFSSNMGKNPVTDGLKVVPTPFFAKYPSQDEILSKMEELVNTAIGIDNLGETALKTLAEKLNAAPSS